MRIALLTAVAALGLASCSEDAVLSFERVQGAPIDAPIKARLGSGSARQLAGDDFLFNFQLDWAAGTGGVVIGDVISIEAHSMIFDMDAPMPNVTYHSWDAYITDVGGVDVTSTLAYVPEPSTAMLLGFGLAAISISKRQRRPTWA